MSVIATLNIKSQNIFNTMEFKIEDIDFDKKRFKINNDWYEQQAIFNIIYNFILFSTVYKYQGGTYRVKIIIFMIVI